MHANVLTVWPVNLGATVRTGVFGTVFGFDEFVRNPTAVVPGVDRYARPIVVAPGACYAAGLALGGRRW